LRELRLQLDSEEDHERAVLWIRTCIVIHSLIHQIEGPLDEQFRQELIDEGLLLETGEVEAYNGVAVGAAGMVGGRESPGQLQRNHLKALLFESTDRY
jgi:hypothetical protein